MIHVLSDIIQIVVLSTGTDALLRVARPRHVKELHLWIASPKEFGLELIHASIGK